MSHTMSRCDVTIRFRILNYVRKIEMKSTIKLSMLSLSAVALLSLSGCGGGSSDTKTALSPAFSGIGIDGILMNSQVCIDANSDGVCNSGEVTTQTDADGKFTFAAGSPTGPLILSGGIDKSTGETFKGILKAPAGSSVVTPLTSAIQSIMDNNSSVSAADAEATIKTAMGLDGVGVNLTEFDPYNGINGVNAAAAKQILAKQTQLQILVHTAATTIAGADAGTDVADAMSNVFDAIVGSMDTGAEVALDAQTVAMATRQAASETYAGKVNADALVVAVGTVAEAEAADAVSAANGAEAAISGGAAGDAIGALDGAINAVNDKNGSTAGAALTAQNTLTDDERAAIIAAREAEDAAAREAAVREAQAVAARVAAVEALAAATTKAELEAAERLRADAAAAEQLAAEKAALEAQAAADKTAAELAASLIVQAEADTQAVVAQAQKEAADAAALAAAIEAQAAAAAAAAIAEADEAAALTELQAAAEAAALAAEQVRAVELVGSYIATANNAAATAQTKKDALVAIAVSYTFDTMLAETAAAQAQADAETLTDYNSTTAVADLNTTHAQELKDNVLTQALIVSNALTAAQAVKSEVDIAVAITQGQRDRIEIIATDVNETKASSQILMDVNGTALGREIGADLRVIREVSFNPLYPTSVVKFDDANRTAVLAHHAYIGARDSLALIIAADANVTRALSDVNETAAASAQVVANTQKVNLENYFSEIYGYASTIASLRTTVERIKSTVDGEETDRVALAIQTSKQTAQSNLDLAIAAANDANASHTRAQGYATTAQTISNLAAATLIQAVGTHTSTAGTQAGEAATAAGLAGSEMSRVFVTNVADINESAAANAASLIASYRESAVAAKNAAQTAAESALAQLTLAQNVTTPTPDTSSSGVLAFTFPHAWYGIRGDDNVDGKGAGVKIHTTTFDRGTGQVTDSTEAYIFGTDSVVPRAEHNKTKHILTGNTWTPRSNASVSDFTISTDNKVIFFEKHNADVILQSSQNIAGVSRYVDVLEKNVTFSAGAQLSQYAYRVHSDVYELDKKVKDHFSQVESYFTSIESFIDAHDNNNSSFIGNNSSGICFASGFSGTLVEGSTGGLVVVSDVNHTGNVVVTNQNAGTWEYKEVGTTGVFVLILDITAEGYRDNSGYMLTMFEGVVYKGWVDIASSEFRAFDELSYNEVAKNDIIDAAKNMGTGTSPATPISDILSAGNGIWGEYKEDGSLNACYVHHTDGTLTITEGNGLTTLSIHESENNVTWEYNGTPAGPVITVANGYSSTLIQTSMIWYNADGTVHNSGNREWRKMDSCSIGGTTPPQSNLKMDIERLTLSNTTWSWQDLKDDGSGTYIVDPNKSPNEESIVNGGMILSVNGGDASVKYMGTVSNFNTTIFSSGIVHKLAYIMNVDDVEKGHHEVLDHVTTPATSYTTLDDFIADYTRSRRVYSNKNLPAGQGLILVSKGGLNSLTIVDSSGKDVMVNAGTYTRVGNTLKTVPTYTGYNESEHIAFIEENNKVYYGNYVPAYSGGIFYLFDATAKDEFKTWFNANSSTLTNQVRFGEAKTDWQVEFNTITVSTQAATDFIALGTLYNLEIDD